MQAAAPSSLVHQRLMSQTAASCSGRCSTALAARPASLLRLCRGLPASRGLVRARAENEERVRGLLEPPRETRCCPATVRLLPLPPPLPAIERAKRVFVGRVWLACVQLGLWHA